MRNNGISSFDDLTSIPFVNSRFLLPYSLTMSLRLCLCPRLKAFHDPPAAHHTAYMWLKQVGLSVQLSTASIYPQHVHQLAHTQQLPSNPPAAHNARRHMTANKTSAAYHTAHCMTVPSSLRRISLHRFTQSLCSPAAQHIAPYRTDSCSC